MQRTHILHLVDNLHQARDKSNGTVVAQGHVYRDDFQQPGSQAVHKTRVGFADVRDDLQPVIPICLKHLLILDAARIA
ncbi:MAG: hypothetical protein BWY09_02607 [Candidatus Hydrogenedentes bacterium ADurb.Bin179]|nr:MAG: hypothetical protein BWY09_02607 [Candidatus Hydrogenedentes bacterium ADurb.Bin179]